MADIAISTAAYERCIERSRLRRRALTMAVSLGESFPRQLAKSIGVDCWRLNALLHGDGKDYAEDLGLVNVGLLAVRETPHGRAIYATTAGVRKARQLSARDVRREEVRRARRERQLGLGRARGAGEGEAESLGRGHGPPAPAGSPVATPEADPPPDTQSWRWSTEA